MAEDAAALKSPSNLTEMLKVPRPARGLNTTIPSELVVLSNVLLFMVMCNNFFETAEGLSLFR